MEKKIKNHLVGFGSLQDLEEYHRLYLPGRCYSEIQYYAYQDKPSKEECNKLCEALSGEVVVYNRKK